MAKDIYTWCALYQDGTFIGEDDRPEGRGFAEVDGTRVKQLKIESSVPTLRSHFVEIPAGAEAVFFRRRTIVLNERTERSTVHCIGWKRGESGVYLFVTDDGSTLLTNDLQAV